MAPVEDLLAILRRQFTLVIECATEVNVLGEHYANPGGNNELEAALARTRTALVQAAEDCDALAAELHGPPPDDV
jgi:hypothetical protein